MIADMLLSSLILLGGVLVLVAAWLVHWVLIAAGVVLILIAMFLATGGAIAGF